MGETSEVIKIGVALMALCAALTVSMFIFVIVRSFEQEVIEDSVTLTDERLTNLTDFMADDYPMVSLYNLLQDSWKNSETLACVHLIDYNGGTPKTNALLWNENIPVDKRPSISIQGGSMSTIKTYESLSPLLHEYAAYTGRITSVSDIQVCIVIGG